jgi:hypothetical protein
MACKICDGTGWVCENHPRRPWSVFSRRADACACGLSGIPCFCNVDALNGSADMTTEITARPLDPRSIPH